MQRRYFILAATALAACGASGPVTLPPDSTLILTRHGDRSGEVMHPQPSALREIQRRLKASFDPHGLFNPGHLYSWL